MKTATKKTKPADFNYRIRTTKSPKEIFLLLLDVKSWWSGFYEETITGKSSHVNDEFSFLAGGGLHFSRQKLIELVPHSKIVWRVVESKLTFLDDPNEWLHTKIKFDIAQREGKTTVTFTHEGLIPNVECYNSCSSAWTAYMAKLELILNGN